VIKIFLTVCNRLAITKKCIEALQKHSLLPHQIYVYNNHSTYLVDEHFNYFCDLYKNKIINQVSFTTQHSTFNSFSKAATCNFFGCQHNMDPQRDSYKFLLFLDNDIIVTPGWDVKLEFFWKFITKKGLNDVKVLGQLPGGIKDIKQVYEVDGLKFKLGYLGGSALWSVRPNFFDEVGFLNLKQLVGQYKKHDQMYWRQLQRVTNGKPYIAGIGYKLGIHVGLLAGSICNVLTKARNAADKLAKIKFEEQEKKIDKMSFEEFYNMIISRADLAGW
jgi:hypothetical protein